MTMSSITVLHLGNVARKSCKHHLSRCNGEKNVTMRYVPARVLLSAPRQPPFASQKQTSATQRPTRRLFTASGLPNGLTSRRWDCRRWTINPQGCGRQPKNTALCTAASSIAERFRFEMSGRSRCFIHRMFTRRLADAMQVLSLSSELGAISQ